MDENEFLEFCTKEKYNPKSILKFKSALALVKEKLRSRKRLSGDTFFEHNLRVGKILAENNSPEEIVLAGLLHGSADSGISKTKIKENFGEEVFQLIEGVEEIKKIKSQSAQLEAEAVRKVLLTTLKDVRVLFVKLANKLDNLRSVNVLPENEQKRVAEEILEVYSPLAYRFGMEKVRTQLEDLAFEVLFPKRYAEIAAFLESSKEQREKDIIGAMQLVKKVVSPQLKIVDIKGRPKHIYSIYKKAVERKVSLHQQYDLLGLRMIVPEEKDCYFLLGLLHEFFEPLKGRLKDYVTNPKPNYYRSIHTAVRIPNGKIVEIQIRTPEMDDFAENGLAAHWRYKSASADNLFEKRLGWLKGVIDLQKKDHGDHKEFLETAKVDIFGDNIHCYTPKGEMKELPKNATVLDFAYLVHEEVGNHAVAGRVNGKFVTFKQQLERGDVVEIITNKSQRPRRSWLKIVKSGRAKQKIRKSLKEHEKLFSFHYRSFKPVVTEEQGVLVESEEFPKAVCVIAKCCLPLPGEDITGIATKRRIISVHGKECRLALKESSRWVKVNWKNKFNQKIRFYVNAGERSGLLADLLHTIATAKFEVKEAKAKPLNLENTQCSFLLVPRDLDHLKELVERVNKVRGIKKVFFE